ncbi:MAG: ACP S-malonyltransferase [Pseudobdellovibrionaceae bacterium]
MESLFLFPGQGSQKPGMGQFLYDNFAVARETFEEASDSLKIDFKKLCFNGSESDLAMTENTQPCLLLVSTVTHRVLKSLFPLIPKAAAGHSIGEYAAVVSAGAMPFGPALQAVRIRGQAMQEAVPVGQGGMVAVLGLEEEQVKVLCQLSKERSGLGVVEAANFNSPGQVVVSGHQKALDWMRANVKAEELPGAPKRMKFIPLQVSAPFHCSLMKPAEEKMRFVLGDIPFQDATFPIVQNFTAQAVTAGPELRENLIRQVSGSVLWMQGALTLKQMGTRTSLELGCGTVISGLMKKIDSGAFDIFNVNSLEDIETLEKFIKEKGQK